MKTFKLKFGVKFIRSFSRFNLIIGITELETKLKTITVIESNKKRSWPQGFSV